MSKELKHKDAGTALTQTEDNANDRHQLDTQEQGDVLYASSATQLSGLVHGNAGNLLQSGGHAADPSWVDHTGAADPHTGYRLESADHSHQSTGAQAGQLDHGLALTGLTDDDHTQYVKHSLATAASDFLVGTVGAWVKKTLAETIALFTNLGTLLTKNPPIDADKVVYRDSTASDVLVTSTWTQVKAFLKTYFDTLYNLYVHPNHSGEVTSVADGAQTIANDAVTYAKMQNVSATDKVLGRATAGAGDAEEIACTAAGRALIDDATAAAQRTTLGLDVPYNKNAIINGCMRVAQRGTSFTAATAPLNNNDTYLLDRWTLLSDGNDIVDVSRVTTPVPVGSYAAVCFDIETEDKKWGFIQILEAKDSARFIGNTVSLQFKARMGAADTSTLLRAAVLAWSSTADTVTSGVVNAWGAEGANPTMVANWTLENVPAALAALTADYQTYKIEGISIDTASTTNIAVFIWSDDMTNAVGDLVYITDVQLELGSVAAPFEFRPFQQELSLCHRYYEKSAKDGFYVGVNDGYGETGESPKFGFYSLGVQGLRYKVDKRVTPTVRILAVEAATGAGTLNEVRNMTIGGLFTVSAPQIPSEVGFTWILMTDAITVGHCFSFSWDANAEL